MWNSVPNSEIRKGIFRDHMTRATPKPKNQGEPEEKRNASPRAEISSTVAKALGIVDILASKAENGISLAELSVLLGMPKSTTHRYLGTLLELGLAERNSIDRFYLGTKVIELAGLFLANSDLRNESQPVLIELAEISGETIHLAMPSGAEVVYISKVESRHAWGMLSHIGTRLPMYCTALGKSILAFSDDALLQEVLADSLEPRTPHTITSIEALKEELEKVRSRGFAIDDEENEMGICCVGAPIIDYGRKSIAAISISGPRERMDRDRCFQFGSLVRDAARKISKRRGFVDQTAHESEA
jgi:DNA-binding IclR family transcriptional regulator